MEEASDKNCVDLRTTANNFQAHYRFDVETVDLRILRQDRSCFD